ncbi:MAG: CRISPR system precrRNA processing endoribonuclease RAMP protein Cas6 [Anaerolineae bacterium]|nr:CRISPR system precrRNA processing endoribonuclease RAMP protein Cas6 [Anaerolineae bacterium]
MDELLSLVIVLNALDTAPQDQPLPLWWGRAVHAMFLQVIRAADENLAASLHDEQSAKPYTVSNLMGKRQANRLLPQQNYWLRLTSYDARLTHILLQAVAPGGRLAQGSRLELDYLPFTVQAVYTDPQQHPWAAHNGFAALAAQYLTRSEGLPRSLTLQFASPLCFKNNGVFMPLPLPGLVFGSLLDKWNAAAPIAFPEETRRFAQECLTVGSFHLNSRRADLKANAARWGAVGQARYHAVRYDRYWLGILHTLAAFALFCGAGVSAAMGMGQCRAHDGAPSADDAGG